MNVFPGQSPSVPVGPNMTPKEETPRCRSLDGWSAAGPHGVPAFLQPHLAQPLLPSPTSSSQMTQPQVTSFSYSSYPPVTYTMGPGDPHGYRQQPQEYPAQTPSFMLLSTYNWNLFRLPKALKKYLEI